MFVLQLSFLLHSIYQVSSYGLLNEKQMPFSTLGGSNLFNKYVRSITEVPYHVLVVYSNLYCSGSLVRSKIVVTAASCLTKRRIHRTVVKLGANSITGAGQVIPVVDIKIHEYYRHMNRMDNDIAMLVLEDHVHFGENVKKVILVESEIALRSGINIDVSGWGGSNILPKFSNMLLRTEMTVMDIEECFEVYKNLLTPSNFCAKYFSERRLSDNGGPAVYKGVLVGIVSFGATNTDAPHIAVLTNASYFHRWMMLNTKRLLREHCMPSEDLGMYAQY